MQLGAGVELHAKAFVFNFNAGYAAVPDLDNLPAMDDSLQGLQFGVAFGFTFGKRK